MTALSTYVDTALQVNVNCHGVSGLLVLMWHRLTMQGAPYEAEKLHIPA